MLRIPYILDNRLTDGGKFVSRKHPPQFTPPKRYYFYVFGAHFFYRLGKPQGLVRPEGLGKFKNSPHRVCVYIYIYIYVYTRRRQNYIFLSEHYDGGNEKKRL
jgi:hypothetical protein